MGPGGGPTLGPMLKAYIMPSRCGYNQGIPSFYLEISPTDNVLVFILANAH